MPWPAGGRQSAIRPGRRREVALGRLGVDPAFDGVAGEGDVLLRDAEAGALRNSQLLRDQVDACHLLRHRMLHLDAHVGLDEIGLVARNIVEELDRACASIGEVPRKAARGIVNRRACLGGQRRCRRLLHDLLKPPLD